MKKETTSTTAVVLTRDDISNITAEHTQILDATDLSAISREDLESLLREYIAQTFEMEETLLSLEARLCVAKVKLDGRKDQVLKILQSEGHITVEALAKRVGINGRNISSQLTYLRKDGYAIATDSLGRKFLEAPVKTILRKSA